MADESARQPFAFERAMETEKRKARALEFIAYYLDRIDLSLSALAEQAKPAAKPGPEPEAHAASHDAATEAPAAGPAEHEAPAATPPS